MNQTLKYKKSFTTDDDQIPFTIRISFSTPSTHILDEKSQIASLGIPDNESLEDAEKDMEQFAKNSTSHWED